MGMEVHLRNLGACIFFPTGNMKTTRGFKKKSKKHQIYIFKR